MKKRCSELIRALGFALGLLLAGPSHGQETPPSASDAPGDPPAPALAAEPVVTRASAHDDFGRIVFDWPRTVGYEAAIQGTRLTVMFEQPLRTTFWQIQTHLEAYIAEVDLSPDGRRVTAALTGDYGLRTFTLSSESGLTKVVVDLLADGGAGRVLAQAPTSPSEPSPEAVPGAASTPTASGDPPPSPPPRSSPGGRGRRRVPGRNGWRVNPGRRSAGRRQHAPLPSSEGCRNAAGWVAPHPERGRRNT